MRAVFHLLLFNFEFRETSAEIEGVGGCSGRAAAARARAPPLRRSRVSPRISTICANRYRSSFFFPHFHIFSNFEGAFSLTERSIFSY